MSRRHKLKFVLEGFSFCPGRCKNWPKFALKEPGFVERETQYFDLNLAFLRKAADSKESQIYA